MNLRSSGGFTAGRKGVFSNPAFGQVVAGQSQ